MESETDLFLSHAELVALTGATQPAAQERIITREIGLMAYRNRNNEVRLAREALVRLQLGEAQASKHKTDPSVRIPR